MTIRVIPVNLGSTQRAVLTGGTIAIVDRLYFRGRLLYGDSHLSVGGVVSARGEGRDNIRFTEYELSWGSKSPLIASELDLLRSHEQSSKSELVGIIISSISKLLLIARARCLKAAFFDMQLLHCFGINLRAHRKLTR